MWAYKPDGTACMFDIQPGDKLPPGWSFDVGVIIDPAHRDGQRLSEIAKESILNPIVVGKREKPKEAPAPVDAMDEVPLLYDENNRQVSEIKQKPPKV